MSASVKSDCVQPAIPSSYFQTYNLDKQVSDSAGTATAYLTGVKANYRTLGVTGNVPEGDCEGSLKPENRLDSILQWAQDAGKDTGRIDGSRGLGFEGKMVG